MICEVHNFAMQGPCPHCFEIISKKRENGTLTEKDLELVQILKKATDDEITAVCNKIMGIE